MRLNIKKYDNYGLSKIPELMDIIEKMLQVDPMKRISPKGIMDHPFCKLYGPEHSLKI